MSLTIVTGPPASGKTEHLVGLAAERYAVDPLTETLVFVPTVRHADRFRRRLVARCGVAFGLQVVTIDHWSRTLLTTAVPTRGVASALLERVTADAIHDDRARAFAPLAGTAGLQRMLEAAAGELLAEGVPAAVLAAVAGRLPDQPRLLALAAVLAAFEAALAARGWLHPASVAGAAAAAVHAGAAVPPLVLVDGFQSFRGGEQAVLAALAERTTVAVAFDGEAGARSQHDLAALCARVAAHERVTVARAPDRPRITAASAPDREAQLRAIAREIKQLLTDDPALRPSDCAVTFRQVTPYLALARQVFAEYDLPLDPAAGERLADRPLGIWLRRLLQLGSDGWRMRDLVSVLSSGFLDRRQWGLGPFDLARIGRVGRERHLWGGEAALDQLVHALTIAAPTDTDATDLRASWQASADALSAALATLRPLLAPALAPLHEHATALDRALFGPEPLIAPAARDLPGAAVEIDALRAYLHAIAAADLALPGAPVTFDAFVARLEHELDAPAVLLREAGGVLLAPMHTLHGLRFAYLAIGGLIEGEFPARHASASMLDRGAREALTGAGLALPPEARASETELWEAVSTRADDHLALWRSRLDARGRPAAASFYFTALHPIEVEAGVAPASRREVAIASTQAWRRGGLNRPAQMPAWPLVRAAAAIEQRRRSFAHAAAYEGDLSPGLVPRLADPDAVWSATRIEVYRICAFRFFGQYALGLRELESEQDSADAATRGLVIHAMLQAAVAPLATAGAPLDTTTLDATLARLRLDGLAIWEAAPAAYGFGRAALWRLQAGEVLHQLEGLLRSEATANVHGLPVRGVEYHAAGALPLVPPLLVAGGIDRLDANGDMAVVVDYKSGRPIPRSQVVDGSHIQLQLYAHLARVETGASRVVARYAWVRPPAREWDLDSARPEDAALIAAVAGIAEETRDRIQQGDFRVNPQIPCPHYCDFRHMCRVNEFTRWKHWD